MDPCELAEAMLDAISNHANVCLARASNASLMADRAEDREQRGRLSAESERWREAYQQLRNVQDECQRIFDEAA